MMTQTDDDGDGCPRRYRDSFTVAKVPSAETELYPGEFILEGDCRLEILGIHFDGKSGFQGVGNYHRLYLYWRILPQIDETLKAKHLIIHRYALAKSGPGMAKICLFNSAAKDFINKFLADYKDALTTTIKA